MKPESIKALIWLGVMFAVVGAFQLYKHTTVESIKADTPSAQETEVRTAMYNGCITETDKTLKHDIGMSYCNCISDGFMDAYTIEELKARANIEKTGLNGRENAIVDSCIAKATK